MKRIQQLRDLSVDHHHGLVLARRARKAAESNNGSIISKAWDEIEAKFKSELEPHFQIEEKYIAPSLARKGITEELDRFYEDHRNLRRFVEGDIIKDGANLIKFSELLTEHIRFEEEELFDLSQNILDKKTLDIIEKMRYETSELHK